MKISSKAKNAILLGALCSISYLAVYIARNVLSAVTPQMIENGFSEVYIGKLSSVYFVVYAVGQLINGIIGDKIKARYMISLGLLLAGACNALFPFISEWRAGAILIYAMTGFFLAMIYGPMAKVVAENTEPKYTTRCSIGYTFSSFFGSPMAGMLAMILSWQGVFVSSSIMLFAMAIISFGFFLSFEKKGIVKYNQYVPCEKGAVGIRVLFKHNIVKYTLVAILTGIVRTSVVFWLPTYISQHLGFSSKTAAGLFTVATLFISTTTFVAVFIYERLHNDLDKTVLVMFLSSALFFAGTYFFKQPIVNIILMILAIMSADGASAMLWSRYCPSLRDTGKVSAVTGFLDFVSYVGAAIANIVFANAVLSIGWGNLILVWLMLMVLGVVISLPYRKKQRKTI